MGLSYPNGLTFTTSGGGSSVVAISDPLTLLEIGDSYMANGTLVNPTYNIYAAGLPAGGANPCVLQIAAHTLTTGDQVFIKMVKGMTEINEITATITVVDSTHISLDGIDSTAYTAYVSGGHVMKITGTQTIYNKSYFSHANALLGNRMNTPIKNNRGIIGNTGADVTGRLTHDLPSALGANIGYIHFATNDITAGRTNVQILADLATTRDYLLNTLGLKYVVMFTPPPRDADTAGQKQQKVDLVPLMMALETDNVVVVDCYTPLADPSTRSFKSGYSADGVHVNSLGGQVANIAIADALRPVFGVKTFTLESTNILEYTGFSGTGGSVGGGITNNGCAAELTVVVSSGTAGYRTLSKDSDGKQLFVFDATSGVGASQATAFYQTETAGWAVGEWWQAEFEVELVSESGAGVLNSLTVDLRNNASALATSHGPASGDGAINKTLLAAQCANRPLIIRSPAAKIPTGSTSLAARLNISYDTTSGAVNDTWKLHNYQLFKVSDPYA